MAETTLRRKLLLLFFFLGSGATLGGQPAKAQFFGREPDPYAYSAPFADPRYGDPYGDFDRPQRERPRRARLGAREDESYLLEEERGPSFGRDRTRLAALPPDADPAYSTPDDLDVEVDPNVTTRQVVDDPTGRPAGTITIDTGARKLYLSLGGGRAMEYGVGVGRQGFAWKGEASIGRKAYWPGWDAAASDAASPSRSAGPYGGRHRQSVGRPRALSLQRQERYALPHSRNE